MKIKLEVDTVMNEKYYHLYLNNENIGYQNQEDTIRKVIALIKLSKCDIIIEKERKR